MKANRVPALPSNISVVGGRSRLRPLGWSSSVRLMLGSCRVPALPGGSRGGRPLLPANIGTESDQSSAVSKVKTNYRIKHRLTFMELPQRVVAVEEDDESDQVDEKQPDDCPPGGSSLVFADLALCCDYFIPWHGSCALLRPNLITQFIALVSSTQQLIIACLR